MTSSIDPAPSITVDAARAGAGPHTVHLELAMTRPHGVIEPVVHLVLPLGFAAELATLLAQAVEQGLALRDAAGVSTVSTPARERALADAP